MDTVTFNQAMLANDRVFAIRAGAYTSSDIKEASFNYGYISGDAFKPGGTVAGSAKLIFTSIITTFNKLDKIYPEIGLLVGDSYEWVAMGEYFVNDISIDRNRNTTELDLMDGMFKLNQPFVSDLTYPAQIRDVIREICVKTGIEVEEGVLALSTVQKRVLEKPDKKDITFREVLSQVIQLLGFSAFFNRQGKLEIRGLTESNITITADNYFLHGLSKSEVEYQIAGIVCKKDKEELTVGLRTGRSLELENPLMSQEYLNDLYYDLKEIKYYPFSLDWQGHLKLDVGQWVTLKTNKDETYKVPVLSQSFNFKGGVKSKIGADSKAGNDTQYSYKGFLTKQIEQVASEINTELQQRLEEADKELDRRATELSGAIEQVQVDAAEYADSIKQEISERLDGTDAEYQADKQSQLRQFDEWAKTLAQKVSQADISVDPESGRIQLGTKEITAQNIASLLIMDKGVTTLLANKFYLGAPSENLIKLSPDYQTLTKTRIDTDGYYVNESTDNLFWLSNYEPNPIKRGDELKITGSIQSTKAQTLRVEVHFFDKDKNRVTVGGSVSINANSGGSLIDTSLLIPEVPLTAKYYAIALVASNNTNIRAVRISNAQARIKTGVDMIVDGSITTALLNAAEGDFARLVAKFVQAEGFTAKVADIQSAKIGSLTVDNDAWMRKLVANRIITELLQAFVVQADKIVVPGTTRPVFTIDRDGNISIDTPILKVRGELLATQSDLEAIELTPGPKGEKGDPGRDGLPGAPGVGIRSTVSTYGLSSSETTQPTSWTSAVPTLVKGQYLWTKTVWTYTDNTNETGYTKTYIAKDGNNGADGIAGKDGVGISSTTITYGQSTSGTVQPTAWTSTVPSVPSGQYLWTKTIWTYTDNTSETGYSVARMGANGQSSYTHSAYAWSSDGTDRFTTVYPKENFITNSSFKNGLNNWSTKSWVVDTDVMRNGNPTVKGTFTDASSSAKAIMQTVSINGLSENDDVVWSVWAKSDSSVGQLHLELWGSVYRADINVGTEWTRISLKGKLKSTFNVYIWNTKAGTYWISEPKLEKGIELTPYVPASSEDYINAYPTYMGTYADSVEENSDNYNDYTWVRVLGKEGADGIAGKDGKGITNTVITYGLSSNETTQPATWSASVPTLVKGQYLWTKTVWTYTDNTNETGYTKTYIAKDGNNGTNGIAGKDGVGISSTTITYASSSSGTTAPSSGWTANVPNVSQGQYLWTKTVWSYTDNTTETGYSVARMGANGAQGPQGPQGLQGLQGPKGDTGIQGPKGADGKSSYTHIAYATNSTGTTGFSVTDSANKTYIGMYVDNIELDSTDPSKYKWTLIKGADGAQGIAGAKGADGKTPYLHIAYATNSTGTTGFSVTDSVGKTYIGQYTDYTQADSTDPTKYKWSLIKGEKGDRGETGPQGPAGPQGERGIAGATGATGATGAKGADGRSSYIHIKYSPVANPTDSQITDTPNAYIGVYTDYNQADSTVASAYTWTKWQGKDGANGVAGAKGADGKTTYVHFAYANSANGQTNFNTSYFEGALYVGTLTDYNQADSTNYAAYTWSRLKGETGAQGDRGPTGPQGIQGIQGPQGVQGIPGVKGADGKTQYTHIAYADNSTGGGFSQTDQTKAYIGMYQDFSVTDSTNPASYRWTKWKGTDGSQGVPGPKGADGKTPYIHFAYADNADGTGLTLTDNGQRYMGHYSDYTQADSTDRTKYKWADRWAKIDSGGRNYFKDSRSRTYSITADTTQDYRTFIYDEFWKNNKRFIKSMVRISLDVTFSHALPNDISTMVHFSASPWYSAPITFKGGTTERQHFDLVYDLSGSSSSYKTDNVFIRFTNSFPLNTIVSIENANLYISTVREDYRQAVEDVQADIDSKADQALTQQQITALQERAKLAETELQAKASIDAVNSLIEAYQKLTEEAKLGVTTNEQAIADAAARIVAIQQDLGDYSERVNFLDSYMTRSNEGLIIGRNDGSALIRVAEDRISMLSAGKEVMYISQGIIHIDNGIFTQSIQVGRFRLEQHAVNLDMNVIRYIG
ncbi:TPA: hypothetical protein ACGO8A_000069 [Streptococcus suis]